MFRFSVSTIGFCCQAVVAALMMNIYIVGLNQLSDVEIDKVTCVCSSYGFERLIR